MSSKSFWKKPGVKHFQLVHRSQRDPLVNDPEASQRVLKEIDTSQPVKGGRPVPSSSSSAFDPTPDEDIGDAAAYGIYYDDSEYNYLQHLKTVGDGGESYLVEAPVVSKKGKGKAKLEDGVAFRLPEDSLPSHPLDEVSYNDITATAAPVVGLQPDMDPKIREVLEALDDDAYAVDDGQGSDEEDEFWKDVVGDGGEVEEDFWEEEDDEDVDENMRKGVENLDLDAVAAAAPEGWGELAKFKALAKAQANSDDEEGDEEIDSEGGDTIAELRAASARRPKRGQPSKSQAGSQFSMSSSAMFRNEGLRTLDDRFDQINKMYEEDSDDSWGGESDEEDDSPEQHEPLREDVLKHMDDFLAHYEVLGGKMRPVLEPAEGSADSNAGKLERLRREIGRMDLGEKVEGEDEEVTMRRIEKERILKIVERQIKEEESRGTKKRGLVRMDWENKKEKWDCETVLSTYSNVSNHPRLLRIRDGSGPKPAKIRIDEKTGFPIVDGEPVRGGKKSRGRQEEVEEEDEDVEMEGSDDEGEYRETVTRPRGETPEEKKARKNAVKEERASRRAEKKSTKEAFGNETKRQKKIAGKKVAGGAAADVRVGEGVRRLA